MSKKGRSEDVHEEYYTKYDGLWGEILSHLKNRLVYGRNCKDMICIYCGESASTREHCPPKSFFPEHDYPDNLRVLPACKKCNNGFSQAEEVVRDYLDCMYDRYCNNKSVERYPEIIREYVEFTEQGKELIEAAEIIFKKVAQGLAIYEICDGFGDCGWDSEVTEFICKHWVNQEEWAGLKDMIPINVLPEIGSRASGNSFAYAIDIKGPEIKISTCTMWKELKEGVFSYVVWLEDDVIKARMILRDFFYVEVSFYNQGVY